MSYRSMDAFAPPSIHAGPRGGSWLRRGALGLLTAVLAWSLVGVPNRPNTSLDASWQIMLVRAHTLGMQFGRELIFTWGPWGFLTSVFHLGRENAWGLVLWQTAGQALVAAALVALSRRAGLGRQAAFVALTVAMHWLFMDTEYFALIVLAVLSGLMRRDASVRTAAGWACLLGFLAQFKFTYFVIAGAGTAASVVCWGLRGKPRRAVWICGAFIASVLAAWLAAGQNLDHLYPYLMRSVEVARGYGDAMGYDEPWPVFLWGSGLALACLAYIWILWRDPADRSWNRPAAAFLGFTFLAMWKESFTRADLTAIGGHVFGLFALVAILAPVLGGILFPGRRWHWFDFAAPYCLVAIACFDPDYFSVGPQVIRMAFERNAREVAETFSLPDNWSRQLALVEKRDAQPALRAAIGEATVDVYDFNLGVAILNGLRLAPRPVFQGYSAYTPSLEGWNLRFYQSDRAPSFLIWSAERIDNRYPGEDDAMLVAGLPGHYEPLFPAGPYWLFRKRTPLSKGPLRREPLLSRSVSLGEEVALPESRNRAVWIEADPVPNNLGRFRAALYKPSTLNLATIDDRGDSHRWRLLPRVAKTGFILCPTLETGADVASFLNGESGSWVRSFHFEVPAGQGEFWSHVDISLFALPDIALRATVPVENLVSLGIFDRSPLWITSAAGEEVFSLEGRKAVLLHASSAVFTEVPAGARSYSGTFGLKEGAYTGDGHTAGVGFDLDAIWSSGRRERLWSRMLDPIRRPADRGPQRLEVGLPENLPVRLELRMTPAEPADNRWDWSYLSGVRFVGDQKG